MFSIGDGKRKLIYNYKALESLKLKPFENNINNNLMLTYHNSKSVKKLFSNKFEDLKYNEEVPSQFYKKKKKEIYLHKKQLLNKKIDILLNKAFDKSEGIRHYNSYKDSMNLYNQKLPIINSKSNSNYKNNLFKNKIKKLILTNFNRFFPEQYINGKERAKTNISNKSNLYKKKNKYGEKQQFFKLNFINKEPFSERKKEFNSKIKDKLINKNIVIYNSKNERKLLLDINKTNSNKKRDLRLNKISYY